MNFGTIGAGTIAQALARHLVTAGPPIRCSKATAPSASSSSKPDHGGLTRLGTHQGPSTRSTA